MSDTAAPPRYHLSADPILARIEQERDHFLADEPAIVAEAERALVQRLAAQIALLHDPSLNPRQHFRVLERVAVLAAIAMDNARRRL